MCGTLQRATRSGRVEEPLASQSGSLPRWTDVANKLTCSIGRTFLWLRKADRKVKVTRNESGSNRIVSILIRPIAIRRPERALYGDIEFGQTKPPCAIRCHVSTMTTSPP